MPKTVTDLARYARGDGPFSRPRRHQPANKNAPHGCEAFGAENETRTYRESDLYGHLTPIKTSFTDFKHQVILWQIGSCGLNNGDLRLERLGILLLSPKESKNRIDSYRTRMNCATILPSEVIPESQALTDPSAGTGTDRTLDWTLGFQ